MTDVDEKYRTREHETAPWRSVPDGIWLNPTKIDSSNVIIAEEPDAKITGERMRAAQMWAAIKWFNWRFRKKDPTLDELAARCGIARNTAKNAINTLVELGYARVTHQYNGHWQTANDLDLTDKPFCFDGECSDEDLDGECSDEDLDGESPESSNERGPEFCEDPDRPVDKYDGPPKDWPPSGQKSGGSAPKDWPPIEETNTRHIETTETRERSAPASTGQGSLSLDDGVDLDEIPITAAADELALAFLAQLPRYDRDQIPDSVWHKRWRAQFQTILTARARAANRKGVALRTEDIEPLTDAIDFVFASDYWRRRAGMPAKFRTAWMHRDGSLQEDLEVALNEAARPVDTPVRVGGQAEDAPSLEWHRVQQAYADGNRIDSPWIDLLAKQADPTVVAAANDIRMMLRTSSEDDARIAFYAALKQRRLEAA